MANKSGLIQDKIDWILTLDASQSEQELHKVCKETQQLTDRQKELNQELKQAQIHPKKNAEQIKKLKDELKLCSSGIKDNRKVMQALERQMGLTNLSMSQLKRHAGDLQRQLDRTSKNLHPEEWKKLNDQLSDTRQRMAELKRQSANINPEKMAIEATTLGNIISSALSTIGSKIKNMAEAGIEMAQSADGVQRAFNKLNSPGLLDNLRAATKGTVNDLQLMQAAVKAKDFRIPLEDLGKYLSYAQMKAQETGQSVEYLTDSIIMGLGRQSKQILDNLGLSATEISEEVAKAGVFAQGVTAIVDRQLAEAGDAYVSAADRSAAATVEWENAQMRLGQALIPVKDALGELKVLGSNLLSWLLENKEATWLLTTATITLISKFVKLKTETVLATKAGKVWNAVMATGQTLLKTGNLLMSLFTFNLGKIKTALNALKVAFMSNPFGIILTALTSVISAIVAFTDRTKEATDSMDVMERVSKRVAEADNVQIQRIKKLNERLHDNTLSYNQRNAALKDLENLVPDYHASLSKEGKLIDENTSALNTYIAALEKEAEAKAIEEEMTELTKSRLELERRRKKLENVIKSGNDRHKDRKELKEVKNELSAVNGEISELRNQAKSLNKESAAESTSLIDKLKERKKEVELWSEATEDAIRIKNRELEKIDDEITRLNNLGKAVKKTSSEEMKVEQQLSAERSRLLEQEKRMSEARAATLKKSLDEGLIGQAEYDVSVAQSATQSARERLRIEQELQAQLSGLTFKTAAEREKAESDAAQRIMEAETAVNKARLDEEQTFRDNLKAIRKAGVIERELTLKEQEEVEYAALDTYLKASLQMSGQDTAKATEIYEAYWDAVYGIRQKYAEKEEALQQAAEKDRQQMREQLGLVSWKDSLAERQRLLEEALQKQAITEEEYSRKSTQIWMEAWHEQASYYQGLAQSAFESLQQAEIDTSEAKYDVLISQARQAGQDTTALEEEKEARNLAIQKKYADVNFAVKVSQIIADTAVSIMRAYAELGPKAGTVAAALLSATGAAQVASANAERNKVKQLQPGGTGASSSGTRVLSSGQGGAYSTSSMLGNIIDQTSQAGAIRTIDTGNAIRAAQNSVLDSAQSATPAAFRYGQQPAVTQTAAGVATLERLDETLRSLQRDGIPASVALTEIDRKRELRDRARSIGQKR